METLEPAPYCLAQAISWLLSMLVPLPEGIIIAMKCSFSVVKVTVMVQALVVTVCTTLVCQISVRPG